MLLLRTVAVVSIRGVSETEVRCEGDIGDGDGGGRRDDILVTLDERHDDKEFIQPSSPGGDDGDITTDNGSSGGVIRDGEEVINL